MNIMKTQILLIAFSLLLISCNNRNAEQAETGEAKTIKSSEGVQLSIKKEESKLLWRGTKPGGEHTGSVAISEGKLTLSDDVISGGQLKVDLNYIENNDLSENMASRLVGHLKSEDFFYVEMYPEALFEISSVSENGDTEEGSAPYKVSGNLTLRGVTKSISFPAWITINNGEVNAKSGEFSIDRTLWGVNFKSKSVFAEFKDDYISDMINLQFDVSFAK